MGNKVLIIGIDALDPKIIDKLRDQLPNLCSFETFLPLETTIPPETPVAWSAASTGTNPGKYGIFDFINRDIKTYMPKLNLAYEKPGILKTEYQCAMKGVPFWRILSEKGIQSVVMRWPVTFPAEEIKGRMLSGLGVVDIKGMLNSYSFYSEDEKNLADEGKEKVICVKKERDSELIKTYVSGPLTRKKGEIKDVQTPMQIQLKKDEITLSIDGKDYSVKEKEWSRMINIKFKLNFLIEIHGIFRVYLESIKPFRMFMSSVQIDPKKQLVDITYPKEYGAELEGKIGGFYTLGMPEETKGVTEGRLSEKGFLKQIKEIEAEREKMFFYEFEKFESGVFAFVFDAGDRLKHIFWNNHSEEIPKEIEAYYVEKDRFIGKVLEKLDSTTKLIIFSDHGFSNFKKQFNMNSWLVKEGYMAIKEGGEESGSLFSFVDWNKTKAYSLGFTSLYINLQGRERNGVVDEKEKEDLIDEIMKKLKELKDYDRKVFTSIYKGGKIYKGDYVCFAPDIIIGFSPGYRMAWKSAVGGLDKEIIFDNKDSWKGDHLIDRSHVPGVLFTNFKVEKKNPNIMDIAPSVLKLLNVEIPDYMDGKTLI